MVGVWHPDYDPEKQDFPLLQYGLKEDAPAHPWLLRRQAGALPTVSQKKASTESSSCALLAAIGMCREAQGPAGKGTGVEGEGALVPNRQMVKDCPLSCKRGPRDADSRCKQWARKGQCTHATKAKRMHEKCPLSCVVVRGTKLDMACGFFGINTMRYLPELWRLTTNDPRLDDVLADACNAAAWGPEAVKQAAAPLRKAEALLKKVLGDSGRAVSHSAHPWAFLAQRNACVWEAVHTTLILLGIWLPDADY